MDDDKTGEVQVDCCCEETGGNSEADEIPVIR